MASTNDFLDYVLEQLSLIRDDISYKKMFGEFLLYYKGVVVGGIYDDRFLVKVTPRAVEAMPDATYELPYEGAKNMLSVTIEDDKEGLKALFDGLYEDLYKSKKKKR